MVSWTGLEHICRSDVPLAGHVWYRLGGPARWFLAPTSEAELAAVLARCRDAEVTWRMLGCGANVIVGDEGFDGAAVHLQGEHFDAREFDGTTVRVNAGADFRIVVRESVERGLAGLEKLAGIPGSMGGIVRMNAGGRYGSIADTVRAVRVVDADGQPRSLSRAQVGFAYRHTELDGCVVVGVTLALERDDPVAVRERYKRIWNEKADSQPAIAARSAGCIFKNPPGRKAGLLLDEAGLKGQRVGGAEISTRHANFIVAHPGARARDVLDLIALAKDRVWNTSGVELELEVDVW